MYSLLLWNHLCGFYRQKLFRTQQHRVQQHLELYLPAPNFATKSASLTFYANNFVVSMFETHCDILSGRIHEQ